jgi:putative transcriptional regulator
MFEVVPKSKLRTYRILAGLTQESLAQKVGVSRQTVTSIEKGDYAPSVVLALRLAKTLNCTVKDLFGEDAE